MEGAAASWRRVLVVDDGSILLGALGAALGKRGYEVLAIPYDDETQTLPTTIDRFRPDVVVLDQDTLTRPRCALVEWLRSRAPKFLALRQSDQPTNSAELRRALKQPVTICTPADIQALLP